MLSLFGGESANIQLYGKLPLAKDYLRVGCGDGSGRALREWLDMGFSGAAEHADQPILAFPMCFLRGTDEGAALFGCAWPSSDTGGLRQFPFTVFVERKRKVLLADLSAGLDHVDALRQRLDACFAARGNFGDGQSFLAAMRGQVLDIKGLDSAKHAELDLDTWLGSLWPERGLDGLHAVLAELETLRASPHKLPLRLPLLHGFSSTAQAHAWWYMLTELGLLKKSRVPHLFFPHDLSAEPSADGGAAFLVYFPAAPTASDARWLSAVGEERCGPGDFCHGRKRASLDARAIPEQVAPLSDSLRGALISFKAKGGAH